MMIFQIKTDKTSDKGSDSDEGYCQKNIEKLLHFDHFLTLISTGCVESKSAVYSKIGQVKTRRKDNFDRSVTVLRREETEKLYLRSEDQYLPR